MHAYRTRGLLTVTLGLILGGCEESSAGGKSGATAGDAQSTQKPRGDGESGKTPSAERRSAMDAGWISRTDEREAPQPYRYLLKEGGVLEVLEGQNATLWDPRGTLRGSYEIQSEVTHLDSGMHPHGAGLVLGGTDVEGDDQVYTYFLVRSDQHFLVKTRRGSETQDVVPWTKHEAVAPEDKNFVTHNALAVAVDDEQTRFKINGVVVHSAKTADLPTDGRFGFRLVHDIHVRFTPLQATQRD